MNFSALTAIGSWVADVFPVVIVVFLFGGLAWWFFAQRKVAKLSCVVEGETPASKKSTPKGSDMSAIADDTTARDELRQQMKQAIATLRGSRLGDVSGRKALYTLPWYMLIGPSGAGKSAAATGSGLHFPLGEEAGRAMKGTGGTRDCDWFFTNDGILLDTTGRYTGDVSRHQLWLRFLDLLRRYRRREPINGLIVTVSLEQVCAGKASESDTLAGATALATTLRQRLHEITERLRVVAPVYVLFTHADKIPGFSTFFASMPANERGQAWGGTMDYDAYAPADAKAQFIDHYAELITVLRDKELERMRDGERSAGGDMFTLSRELRQRTEVLARFVEVLFGESHFHGRPVLRGFYLTSAVPEASPASAVQAAFRKKFGFAETEGAPPLPASYSGDGPFFLKDVFHDIILKDTDLVQPYVTRRARRQRMAAFIAMAAIAGLGFAWVVRSYQLTATLRANVESDYAAIAAMTSQRQTMESRLDALLMLQDRLEQLIAFREHRPWSMFPAYDDEVILPTVRDDYFAGVHNLMVQPAAAGFERYLAAVASPGNTPPATQSGTYAMPDPSDQQAAYAALKAYLALANSDKVEPTQLASELTRFWRGWLEENRGDMSREAMIDKADRLVRFYSAAAGETGWSRWQPKVAVVDGARRVLAEAMRGTPARDRVYADIMARASARYPGLTVRGIAATDDAVLTGSHAVPGAYTRAAWEGYIKDAIGDASRKALDTSDWVLQSQHVDDLTLSGSPEHVRKDLEGEYARRYIAEWQQFLAGISVAGFTDVPTAIAALEHLGDSERSPLKAILRRVRNETAWDDVPLPDGKAGAAAAVMRGPVSQAFAGLARLVDARDGANAPLDGYLASLGKLRARLRTIANEGDMGPGARRFLEATLQGTGSELVEALRGTDDDMLNGLSDVQRNALRPLLVRPLVQTFAALVNPVEAELNRIWDAQVGGPFRDELARKRPFDEAGRVDASPDEITRVFGPTGAIARFANEALGPLVERRGDILTPRRWGDRGVTLDAKLLTDFPLWVSADGAGIAGQHTVFQLMPEPTMAGISEYTVTIAGQSLRYRNEVPQWSNFVWGGTQSHGASIEATTTDGRTVRVADFTGAGALGQLVDAAQREHGQDGTHALSWTSDGAKVAMRLRIMTSARVDADGREKRGLRGVTLPAVIAGTHATKGEAP